MLPTYLIEQAYHERLLKARDLTAHGLRWRPIPNSPQWDAYHSQADELFYGGAAGGGKTDLLLGLAATVHHRVVIFRRIFRSARGMVERSKEIFNRAGANNAKDSFNESDHIWRLSNGKIVEFAHAQHEKDVNSYQGQPHDLYGWDEITEFTEYQYRFVNAWNRSTKPGQRCRVVATGNPPTTAEGEWVIRYWAPWLDSQYPYPAVPGELRWFTTIDGKDQPCEDGTPFEYEGELIKPRSRTFIPARLDDNPYLRETGYKGVLTSLPEPLRSRLLYGDFTLGLQDDPWQVIPTEWVQLAQKRWDAMERPPNLPQAVGIDVAHGGQDKTAFAVLYGGWFDEIKTYPGQQTPLGKDVLRLLSGLNVPKGTVLGIDAVGYGASAAEYIEDHGYNVVKINAGASPWRRFDASGVYSFANLRAEMYFKLRDALNPENRIEIALPSDRELLADLCAARYTIRAGKYVIESKDELKARLGRSPDKGEAVLHAWYVANRSDNIVTTTRRS